MLPFNIYLILKDLMYLMYQVYETYKNFKTNLILILILIWPYNFDYIVFGFILYQLSFCIILVYTHVIIKVFCFLTLLFYKHFCFVGLDPRYTKIYLHSDFQWFLFYVVLLYVFFLTNLRPNTTNGGFTVNLCGRNIFSSDNFNI